MYKFLHADPWLTLNSSCLIIKFPGIILSMGSANVIRRYIVTSHLIGWAHIQNDPWTSLYIWLVLAFSYVFVPSSVLQS